MKKISILEEENEEIDRLYWIGKSAFIKNKRALARHKDLADLELLGEKI